VSAPRRPRAILTAAALLLFSCHGVPRADIIHLKNGASVAADSWVERDGQLVIRQRQGTIVVPRSEVERIDRTEAEGAPAGSPEDRPAAPAAPAAGPAPTPRRPTREEALGELREAESRLSERPFERAVTTRTIVALLNYLGSEAYVARNLDEALARFRAAAGYDPRDANAQLGLAVTYLAQENAPYARSTLERALLDHPEDARLHRLLGDVFYGEERLSEALASWERAQAIRPDREVRDRVEKLRREQAIDGEYRRSDGAHFALKYDGEQAGSDLDAEILRFLEGRFDELVRRFDYYPSRAIVVIVYPQRQFYQATGAESSVGGLFDGKIRVPGGGLKRLDPQAQSVLLHELAHAFIAGKSRFTAPRWLHEGIAQMVEGRTSPAASEIALAKEYVSLEGSPRWGTGFTYPSSLSIVEFLARREGFHRLLEVLEAMAGGTDEEEAFRRVTRSSLEELRGAWGESLVAAHLH